MNKILKKLGVKEVFVGTDYRFGHGASGSVADLRKHFDVHAFELLSTKDGKISTSTIIKSLDDGDVEKANELLGYDYQIRGVVGYGNQVGNKIGFPTANLDIAANYVLPKNGVYKTICYVDGKPYLALTNIGVHPTLGASDRVLVESYLLHYEGNAYGKTMYVAFLSRLRDEKKFDDVADLKKQIAIDLDSIK
jgi:riboflavin kinase/FMN adenylyltransferase